MKDYYKILELQPDVTQKEIREQYRFLLHAWHPDKFSTSEQKRKAEEKLKEINEAYDVLGNSVKRGRYDFEYRSSKSPPPRPTQPSPRPTQPPPPRPTPPSPRPTQPRPPETQAYKKRRPSDFPQRCDICGLPAETKYVAFYESIGLLIVRRHRSIEGNLCKPCIDYSFWLLTGRTMLFGWWGIISMIVTPFILLNNLLRYISTENMRKPLSHITPNPPPFWKFSAIGGFSLFGFSLIFLFFNWIAQVISSPTSSNISSVSIVATQTPKLRPTITPLNLQNYLFWDDFSDTSSGWNRYSDAYAITDYSNGIFQIKVNTENYLVLSNPGLEFIDVVVEVEARKWIGPAESDYGIMCRYQDELNYYFFVIGSDGLYGIFKIVEGEETLLGSEYWKYSEVINQGRHTNKIRADCIGETLRLYVNRQKLFEVTDTELSDGDVGLFAAAYDVIPVEIHFDNFVVRKP